MGIENNKLLRQGLENLPLAAEKKKTRKLEIQIIDLERENRKLNQTGKVEVPQEDKINNLKKDYEARILLLEKENENMQKLREMEIEMDNEPVFKTELEVEPNAKFTIPKLKIQEKENVN